MLSKTQKLYESELGAKFRRSERIGKAMNEGTFDFCTRWSLLEYNYSSFCAEINGQERRDSSRAL